MPVSFRTASTSLLSWAARNAPVVFGAAAGLVVLGQKLRLIANYGAYASWSAEWWQETLRLTSTLTEPSADLWTRLEFAILRANQQWDPSLEAGLCAILWALGVSVAVTAFLKALRPSGVVLGGAITLAASVFFTFWSFSPPGPQLSRFGIGLFSLVHLFFSTGRRGTVSRGIGALAGLGATISGSFGFLSAVAVLVELVFRVWRRGESGRELSLVALWNGILVVLGLCLAPPFALGTMPSNDYGFSIWLLVAPPVLFLIQHWVTPSDSPLKERLAPLALLVLLHAATIAGNMAASAPLELVAVALFISVGCLAALTQGRWQAFRIPLAGALIAFLLNSLWFQSETVREGQWGDTSRINEQRSTEFRRYLTWGDFNRLRLSIPEVDAPVTIQALATPAVRSLLPFSVRTSLQLASDDDASIEDKPEIKGRGQGLPAWASTSGSRSSFRSELLQSSAALLQLQVAGKMKSGVNDLRLQTADGREWLPLQPEVNSPGLWRRVNFPNPQQPFRVVATVTDLGNGLAFTAPVEAGQFSWLSGKILNEGRTLFFVGLLLGGVGLVLASGWAWTQQRGELTPSAWPDSFRYLPSAGIAALAVITWTHLDVFAGGSDSAGYLNLARLFGQGDVMTAARTVPNLPLSEVSVQAYTPNCFLAIDDARISPIYPPGLPLLLATIVAFASPDLAIPAVIMVHFLAGVWLTYVVGRMAGLSKGWSWLAAGAVALSPLYLFIGLQAMSDVPSLVWATVAVVLAWRGRDKPALALMSGAALSFAVLLRPANLLVIPAVLAALEFSPRRLSYWIVGGLPGAIWQLWFGHTVYGGALKTGYGDVGQLLGAQWLVPTIGHYAIWLPAALTPLVLLAVIYPFLKAETHRMRLVLTLWVGAYLAFYSIYFFTHQAWWYLRFLIPVLPPILVMALIALRSLLAKQSIKVMETARTPRERFGTGVLIGGVALWLLVADVGLKVFDPSRQNSVYPESARWLEQSVPKNAVVFADYGGGALFYYTNLVVVRCYLPAEDRDNLLAFAKRKALPVFAMVFDYESDAFRSVPGDWVKVGDYRNAALWRWRSTGAK